MNFKSLTELNQALINCQACKRLTDWCQKIAQEKRAKFHEEEYWGKPVPSFGDKNAQLLIVGLAPAAHGGNRTGRMFTGDNSGNWLYRALYKAGFANQVTSVCATDNLVLHNCYITAVAHCAPPDNVLQPDEILNCRHFLQQELKLLRNLRVIVALGNVAFRNMLNIMWFAESEKGKRRSKRPEFGHGREVILQDNKILISSYHPSQHNTFTGRLTEPMLDAIFSRAKHIMNEVTAL